MSTGVSVRRETTQVLFVRHGQSEDNVLGRLSGWSDSPLTDLGQKQAKRTAEWIAGRLRPNALYVSPLSRARQTAEPLVQRIGLEARSRHELRELFFGDLDGLTVAEIEARFPGVWPLASDESDIDYRFPNGEVRREFYARIRDAYDDIVREHRGESVVVVTHGGVISSLLAHLAAGDFRRWRDYSIHNCGIVEIQATPEHHVIVTWNAVDHLAGLPVW